MDCHLLEMLFLGKGDPSTMLAMNSCDQVDFSFPVFLAAVRPLITWRYTFELLGIFLDFGMRTLKDVL